MPDVTSFPTIAGFVFLVIGAALIFLAIRGLNALRKLTRATDDISATRRRNRRSIYNWSIGFGIISLATAFFFFLGL